ncbi:hypothetical protein ACAW74_25640 [Fibrella sp. WM1]|uniref:hypothetical protein n=1 Tax=Fibrella musci TaxID=3242485 RepID=UPI0035213942
MAVVSRATLYTIFGVLGKIPGAQDFKNWLDSYVHKDELAEVNAATINRKITAYDQGLRTESNALFVSTLGDMLKAFAQWPRGQRLIDFITSAGLDWSKINNRPAAVALRWNEQIVSVDPTSTAFGAIGSYRPSDFTVTKWLLSEVAARTTGTMVIIDMQVSRKLTGATTETNSVVTPAMVVDVITKVKIGVNPSVNLT